MRRFTKQSAGADTCWAGLHAGASAEPHTLDDIASAIHHPRATPRMLPKEKHPKLYKQVSQADHHRAHAGKSSLGLAVTKHSIQSPAKSRQYTIHEDRTLMLVPPRALRVLQMVKKGPSSVGRKVSPSGPVFHRVTCGHFAIGMVGGGASCARSRSCQDGQYSGLAPQTNPQGAHTMWRETQAAVLLSHAADVHAQRATAVGTPCSEHHERAP